ncbi:MAG: hypothetical protein HKN90_01260 [Flavobacteriaceae bacterium]|nr:hypothetical protein [Flavobacteriaceae bacterium]
MSCTNFGQLTVLADLPNLLKEVSGIETVSNSDLIWMLNDGGNKSELYALDQKGTIKKVIKINAKNHDWEDLASDTLGNLYIGDLGNNTNNRTNLVILKVHGADLSTDKKVEIERINFKYPNQKKFPPKRNQRHFDSESFFFYNDSLYIFTKSRVKNKFGKTNLYKIPAKRGNHTAIYINSFESCKDLECWITSADISNDGKKVVLINHKSAWVFTNFKGDDFFSGEVQEFPFEADLSQKEGVCFKNENTIYITDEYTHGSGGNLYEFSL